MNCKHIIFDWRAMRTAWPSANRSIIMFIIFYWIPQGLLASNRGYVRDIAQAEGDTRNSVANGRDIARSTPVDVFWSPSIFHANINFKILIFWMHVQCMLFGRSFTQFSTFSLPQSYFHETKNWALSPRGSNKLSPRGSNERKNQISTLQFFAEPLKEDSRSKSFKMNRNKENGKMTTQWAIGIALLFAN